MLARPRAAYTLVEFLLVAFMVAVLGAIGVAALHDARAKKDLARCKSNLNQLGKAQILYADENNDKFPRCEGVEYLATLYRTGCEDDSSHFVCPATGDAPDGEALAAGREEGTSFRAYDNCDAYLANRGGWHCGTGLPTRIVMISDRSGRHHDGAYNVLFPDGHVEAISEDDPDKKWALGPLRESEE
ncbi:MAG: hypothetical protein HY720_29750 [Planctomycetes bacterium]|nr:hypothetical protein [Planctomycetota bacterium]